MYYLLYVSYSKDTLTDEDLKMLLTKSRENNAKLKVTGMLMYMKNQFIQVLEGEQATVEALYDKISKDSLHYKVNIMLEGEISKRNFANWTMGYHKIRPEKFESLTGFQNLNDFSKMTEIRNHNHPAVLFLRLFYDKNQSNELIDL